MPNAVAQAQPNPQGLAVVITARNDDEAQEILERALALKARE